MKTALTKTTILASLLVVASAWMISCSGDAGSDGKDGKDGKDGADGTGTAACSIEGRTVTCGDKTIDVPTAGSGSGDAGCEIVPSTKNGVAGLQIICDGSAQDAFIPNTFTADGVNCETKIVSSDRTQFTIDCGGSSTAKVGMCYVTADSDYRFYDALTERCNSGVIEDATGLCGGDVYYLGQSFCRGNENTGTIITLCGGVTADVTLKGDATATPAVPADPMYVPGMYAASEFCWDKTMEAGKQVAKSGTIKSKCVTATGSVEFNVDEFCQAPKTGSIYEIKKLCGYYEGSGPNKTGAQAGTDFLWNFFCQPGAGTTEVDRIKASTTKKLCGDELQYTYEEACAVNGTITSPCGIAGDYTKNYFFCSNNTAVYARCGDTLNADNVNLNPGVFDATKNFCYSSDYEYPKQYLAANDPDSSKIETLCPNKYVVKVAIAANTYGTHAALAVGAFVSADLKEIVTGALAADPVELEVVKNVGYPRIQFCAADNFVYSKCGASSLGTKPIVEGKDFNPINQLCVSGVVRGKCGPSETQFILESQGCTNNEVVMRCLGEERPFTNANDNKLVCKSTGYVECAESNTSGSTGDMIPNATMTDCVAK